MLNDVHERDLFARLAEDAARAPLEGAAELRRRGDRRTTARAAAGAVAVVAVVAGIVLGGSSLVDRTSGPVVVDTPTPAPTPTPTTGPSTGQPTSIPASAWLNAQDLNDSRDPIGYDGDLLRPCADPLLPPAGDLVLLSEARFGSYRAPDLTRDYVPDGTVKQFIRVYEPGTLGLVIQQMDSVATACPTGADVRPTRGQPGLVLLVRLTTLQGGQPVYSWFAALRGADVLSVLSLQGWEGTSSSEADARRLAAAAWTRLQTWPDAL